MTSRKFISLTIAASASFLLAACSSGTSEPQTVTETVSDSASTPASASTSASAPTETSSTTASQGEDPVFAAIDAVLAEHSDGIITNIDREDSRDRYDFDVVVGQDVIELDVDSTGSIREEEREGDNDDVREAGEATVTAAEAITEALSQHSDGVLDDIELNDEDGRLEWEISLDDADGRDLAELTIPAK